MSIENKINKINKNSNKNKKVKLEINKDLENLINEFDKLNEELVNKEYELDINAESIELLNHILENVDWQAVESFALKMCYEELNEAFNKSVREFSKMKVKGEVLDAIWAFIIKYKGKGYTEAKRYTKIAEIVSKEVVNLQNDRKGLMEISEKINKIESANTLPELKLEDIKE